MYLAIYPNVLASYNLRFLQIHIKTASAILTVYTYYIYIYVCICAIARRSYFRIRSRLYPDRFFSVPFGVFTHFTSPTSAKCEVLPWPFYLPRFNNPPTKLHSKVLFIRVSATCLMMDFVYMGVNITKPIQIIQAQDIGANTKSQLTQRRMTIFPLPTSSHFFFDSKLLGPRNVKSSRVSRQAFEVWPLWHLMAIQLH